MSANMTQDELYRLIADMEALASNIRAYANASAEIPMTLIPDLETGRGALDEIYWQMFRSFEGQEASDVS